MKGIRLCCGDHGKNEELLIQELHALYAANASKKSIYSKVRKEGKKRNPPSLKTSAGRGEVETYAKRK